MADYSGYYEHYGPWKYECCKSDLYHNAECEDHPVHGERNKAIRNLRELRESWGFKHMEGDLWACTNGCGTVVWDLESHKKNVCRDA